MKHLFIALLLASSTRAQIQTDKVAHFGVGYVTGAVSSSIVLINSNGKNEWFKSISIGTAVAALFGLGKEIADEKKYGGFNWADLGATALGGAIGSVTIKISINRYEKKHLL